MNNTEKITSVELMDNMPTGTHRVIIDTYDGRSISQGDSASTRI